jgi:hypothetical protein
MVAPYYYIMSSLPFLHFDTDPPLSYSQLTELCIPWLGEKDLIQFQSARLDIENIAVETVGQGTLQRWVLFENSLRNELVVLRTQRTGIPSEGHIRKDMPWDPSVVWLERDALKDMSPLEAEVALLEVRWEFISDLETGHYFDLDALIIYALRIQILERLKRFDLAKGIEYLQRLTEESLGDEEQHRNSSGHQQQPHHG